MLDSPVHVIPFRNGFSMYPTEMASAGSPEVVRVQIPWYCQDIGMNCSMNI